MPVRTNTNVRVMPAGFHTNAATPITTATTSSSTEGAR
jgi:hypothetical protein